MNKKKNPLRVYRIAIIFFMACLSMNSFAQSLSSLEPLVTQQKSVVTGTVTSTNNEPLVGVNVMEKGTTNGTITDIDGRFTIHVSPNAVIVFSYVSFAKKEVVWKGDPVLNVVLREDTELLDEIVVIGYGTNSKRKITGSIAQAKTEELNQYSSSVGLAQKLTGRASGVLINETSGMPGAAPVIQIRGVGTLTAGVQPLIVLDGLPLSEGTTLNSINPNDIETLDILKDPASASIYGSRAANGVIMITTKKASSDDIKVNFDFYTGWQERADNVKYVDAYDAALYFTEARDEAYVRKDPTNRSIEDDAATRISKGASKRDLRLNYIQPYLDREPGLTNTDWFDLMFDTAPISNYNLSVAKRFGGESDFYVGLNYMTQDGILRGNDYKTYRGTFKINSKLSEKIKFGIVMTPAITTEHYANEISALMGAFPFVKPYNEDGSIAVSEQIKMNTPEDGNLNESPIALTDMIKKERTSFRNMGNVFVEYAILTGLKFKTYLGGDYFTQNQDEFNPSNVGGYRTQAPKPATSSNVNTSYWNYITENTLNFTKSFQNHHFDVLAGYSFQKEYGNRVTVNGTGIPDNNLTNISGASGFSVNNARYTWVQVSWYARLQYEFNNRYLLGVNFRRDGSSRFGINNQWGNFPSVSAGWIVSDEKFMSGISKKLTFFKIRGSIGMSGNSQINNYGSQALLSASNYVNGSTLAPGYYANTAPNPNISWETQISKNIGFDATFVNKITMALNYYNNTTKDLLLNVPVPQQSGFDTSLRNIGKVRNSGVEFELGFNDMNIGQTKWRFSGNISSNKNKVLALAEGQTQIISGNFITQIGGPIAEFYGYNVLGIYKTQEQLESTPHMPSTNLGDYIISDEDGDKEITPDDKIGFGKTYSPQYFYGINMGMEWNNFDFSATMTGIEGRTVYDGGMAGAENGEAFQMPDEYYFKNRYHPVNNPEGTLPQPTTNFSQNRLQAGWGNQTLFMDGDYFRVRDIQLGYNVPLKKGNRLKLNTLRFYVAANNLFTITKFRGFNPEGTTTNILQAGSASSNYPVSRSYLVGLKLQF